MAGVAIILPKNPISSLNRLSEQYNRPNILVILVDDLGYGDLSSYGAKDLFTPNIDKLMNSGMRFDNFYANCPVCSPTRASLLTGCFPDMVGVPGVIRTFTRDNFGYLDPRAILLPKVLKKVGYHTALVGKWHLGLTSPNTPTERGFDHFYGFLGDMMDDYYTHRRSGFNYMRLNQEEIDPHGHATDLFTEAAVEYIRSRRNKEQPLYLYLAYNAPHAPIQPPQQWLEKVKTREKGSDEKRTKLIALIEHLDDGIGKVIQALNESNKSNDTLIIFTSDNGGQIDLGAHNGRLNGGKGMMYEGGIRVPMCAVWPNHIDQGTKSDLVALTMDLFPTLCEAAGIGFEHEIDGVSILPTLLNKQQSLNDRFLIWVRREDGRYGGRDYYAIRKGDYKLLQNSPYEVMKLYDLRVDPMEQIALIDNHDMYHSLFKALQDHIIKAGAIPWQKYPVKIDELNH